MRLSCEEIKMMKYLYDFVDELELSEIKNEICGKI